MIIDEILKHHDNSLDNIEVSLDNMDYKAKYELLPKLISKVSKGGTFTIVGTDAISLATLIKSNLITIEAYNEIIKNSQSIDSMVLVERFINSCGLTTTLRNIIEDGKYILSTRY